MASPPWLTLASQVAHGWFPAEPSCVDDVTFPACQAVTMGEAGERRYGNFPDYSSYPST